MTKNQSQAHPEITVVIPCFNEQQVVGATYKRLTAVLSSLIDKDKIATYYLLFVNDGSTDETLSILKQLAKQDRRIKVISFSRNFGHQAALAAGLHHAEGDAVVTMDADLQDPPEVIEDMVDELNKGYDIVFGVRRTRQSDTFFKRATAHLFYKFMKIMGVNLIYDHADFRLLSRRAVEEFKKFGEVNLFLRGIIPSLGFNQSRVFYDREERMAGETKYPLHRMLAFAWEAITSFSAWPLRIAGIAGLIVSFIAFVLLGWALYIKIVHKALPGWTSIVVPVYFLGGLNLISIGLVGEYLNKVYMETKKRPLYILMEKINFDD